MGISITKAWRKPRIEQFVNFAQAAAVGFELLQDAIDFALGLGVRGGSGVHCFGMRWLPLRKTGLR